MRQILLMILLFLETTPSWSQTSQTYNIDSLKRVLSADLQDTNRIWALNNLGRNIQNSDTILLLAQQAISLSQKIGFKKGEAEAYNNIAYWYNQKGDYPKALMNYLKAIQLSESVNYLAGLKRSFNSIATVYLYMKDYSTSISYARKARDLSIKLNDGNTLALASSWLSRSFLELNQTDSALKYAQESYVNATRSKDPLPLYLSTARLGEINAVMGQQTLAIEYLRLSLFYSKKDGRLFRIASAHQQLAVVFKNSEMTDSCLWHAKRAFTISKEENLTSSLLASSLLLSEMLEGINDSESLSYHKIALAAQDSLYSQEKNRQVEALSFNESLRQQKLEAEKRLAESERRRNLQYVAIASTLLIFIIVFLLLSHSIIANASLIKYLGILALLMIFEFINLLLGPFIAKLTHNAPYLMLIVMVGLAALLIPVHQRLEKWVTHKLVEKNKRIKLEAAKKIIATLDEPEPINKDTSLE